MNYTSSLLTYLLYYSALEIFSKLDGVQQQTSIGMPLQEK